ncbi:MAG TPA: imelysin family protein [Gemmatimonadaceae bacterium]|nr:imelysin family protein [Gemmatimonadaceae bacterium]
MTTTISSARRTLGLVAIVTAGAMLAACNDSVTAPELGAPTSLVSSIVDAVYLPTFDSLNARASRLSAALDALAANPSPTTLGGAQDAWRATREMYERNEGFAFGPLITNEYDPNMDTWPIDRTGIDALVAGNASITKGEIDEEDGTLKGFHGIEYILFGDNNSTTAASLTVGQRTYLSAAGQSLAAVAEALDEAWSPTGGNFAGQLTSAGSGNSVYASVGAALQEITSGLIEPTDEVPNSKIALPLSSSDTYFEESAFSDNTLNDLKNDLRGAFAVYTGSFSGDANGISTLIASQSPSLDAQVRAQFTVAFAALDAVGPSFDQALHDNPDALRTAQQAIITLNHTLVNQVAPLVGAVDAD